MAGVQLRTLPVGSEVKLRMIDVYPEGGMWVAGISYTYRILHQGKPSSAYDDSCNGTWVIPTYASKLSGDATFVPKNGFYKDTPEISVFTSRESAQASSNSRIGAVITSFQAPVLSGAYGSSAVSGIWVREVHLSATEVGLLASTTIPVLGSKLDYFIQGNDAAANEKRKMLSSDGTPVKWFTRTQTKSDLLPALTTNFVVVDETGASVILNGAEAHEDVYSITCRIMNSSISVDEEGYIIVPTYVRKPIPCIKY